MRKLSIIVAILAFWAGVVAGFVTNERLKAQPSGRYTEIRESGFKYVSPLLDCENAGSYVGDEIKPFKNRVEHFIKGEESKKWGDDISIYFRDLKNGPSFSIGREERFYPASLLKVPEMISILKEADVNPLIMKKRIVYNNPDLSSVQNTDVPDKLILGKSYSVEELLKRMIVYSDNVSSLLLEDMVNPLDLEKAYDDLGIPDPYYLEDQKGYMISAELYSFFFRILYNASYLSKQMSEKALEYLAETDYKKGLVAGVPPDVAVAHKFGIRKKAGIKQLHDCGIIYYPSHPYLLCVMTSGSAPEYLDSSIADVSRFIYREVDRQHHGLR